MRIKREFIDHVLFVIGSIFTCALVLATSTGHSQSTPRTETEARHTETTNDRLSVILSTENPVYLEANLKPSLQLCAENTPAIDARLASLDFKLILESQYAKRKEEPLLHTVAPTWVADKANQPFESTDECANFDRVDVARAEGPFATDAAHLLCESVESSEGLYRADGWTFSTIALQIQ